MQGKKGTSVAQVKVSKISSRCSPSGFHELLASLNLSEDVKRVFGQTPFGHFLQLPNHKVEISLVNELVNRFDTETAFFNIGGNCLKFEDKEVAMILGLRLHGRPVDLQNEDGRSTFLDGFLKGKPLKRPLLTQKLRSLSYEQGETSVENIVKLLLIALFNFVLFPIGEYETPIALYKYVDELEKLDEYAWGDAVYKFLVHQMRKELGKGKRCGYLSGCNMALTVWFYEHMQGSVPAFVYDTTFKLVNKEAFPRVLKWGTGNYKHEGTYKSLLSVIGLLQDMSCLEPACNREASYICPSKEESIPDRERATPSLDFPTIVAPNPLAGETNSTDEKSIPSGISVNPIAWCSPPSTKVNENNRSRESDDEVVEFKKLRRDVDALKGLYRELLEQFVAKDKENKQLRERVDHLETSVKLLKEPLVDNGVDDHS